MGQANSNRANEQDKGNHGIVNIRLKGSWTPALFKGVEDPGIYLEPRAEDWRDQENQGGGADGGTGHTALDHYRQSRTQVGTAGKCRGSRGTPQPIPPRHPVPSSRIGMRVARAGPAGAQSTVWALMETSSSRGRQAMNSKQPKQDRGGDQGKKTKEALASTKRHDTAGTHDPWLDNDPWQTPPTPSKTAKTGPRRHPS